MERGGFYVYRLTESIVDTSTEVSFETEVLRMGAGEWRRVLKKDGWNFNWREELRDPEREVYKLIIKGEDAIQGLISIVRKDNFIEMPLIEVAPHNLGRGKKYYGVPGNLVAFVCMLSFEMGFEGYVGFEAKTKLIQHYE